MRTVDCFKDLLFGMGLLFCFLLVPVELLTLRTAPVLLQHLSPFGFWAIALLSLVISVVLAFYGLRVIRYNLKRYVQLVISNRKKFLKSYSKEATVRNAAQKLHDQLNEKNKGFGQARNLLKVAYSICRSPFLGVSNRKLDKCFSIVKNTCPNVLSIQVEISTDESDFYDVTNPPESEKLVIKYLFGHETLTQKILIAELK